MTIVKAILFWAAVIATALVMLKLVRVAFRLALLSVGAFAVGACAAYSTIEDFNGKIIESSSVINSTLRGV